jgi:hypothetical protein
LATRLRAIELCVHENSSREGWGFARGGWRTPLSKDSVRTTLLGAFR